MPIQITEIHPAQSAKHLNSEWFVLKNDSDKVFSTRNCVLERGRKGSSKTTALGTMDPGFSMEPGESVKVVTGNPGRKAHGDNPESQERVYNLFLAASVLKGSGTTLTLKLRSMTLATVEFDPASDRGIPQ